jgi:hypothetical protein
MRIGKAAIEAQPDGIPVGGPVPEALALVGVIDREAMADPPSMAYRTAMERYESAIATAAGFVWSVSPGNGRAEQIAAGRDWLRVNLAANAAGLSVQPLSQALQEYEEMTDLYDEVHGLLGVEAPERIQMLARIGHGPAIAPTPRWPAPSRIVS